MAEQSCLAARDALNQIGELDNVVKALERRITRERAAIDSRLDDLDGRLDSHEAASEQANNQLANTVNQLNATIKTAVASSPVVPASSAIVQSWRETPLSAKAKITGGIAGLLAGSEFLKALGRILWELLGHLLGKVH